MPIVELREHDFDQQCAVCGAIRSIPLTVLTVGVDIAPGMTDMNVLALPTCQRCSAGEFLVRPAVAEESKDDRAARLPLDRHRQLVSDLYSALTAPDGPL